MTLSIIHMDKVSDRLCGFGTLIEDSPLSIRAVNALKTAGYRSLAQCEDFEEAGLLKIRNIGTKTAKEITALIEAIRLRNLRDAENGKVSEEERRPQAILEDDGRQTFLLSLPTTLLPFSVRAQNVLHELKINYVLNLVSKQPQEILRQRNCGRKTVSEIQSTLKELGLMLGMMFPANVQAAVKAQVAENPRKMEAMSAVVQRNLPDIAGKLVEIRAKAVSPSRTEFYKRCFHEYQQHGTLAKAGQTLGITRERVRQGLVKGSRLGLFEYKPREYVIIPKKKLLEDYRSRHSLAAVARANDISTSYLEKLCTLHGITATVLQTVANEKRREECIEEYQRVQSQLGHHPSTTELQRNTQWRSLWARIARLWGSFDAFREQLSIPKPPPGNPTFREDTRKWRERQKQLALIIKMERLDDLRECLAGRVALSSSEIGSRCGLRYQTMADLLKLLMATGEIGREGSGNAVRYRLGHRGGSK